jgi:hypothetical protein
MTLLSDMDLLGVHVAHCQMATLKMWKGALGNKQSSYIAATTAAAAVVCITHDMYNRISLQRHFLSAQPFHSVGGATSGVGVDR